MCLWFKKNRAKTKSYIIMFTNIFWNHLCRVFLGWWWLNSLSLNFKKLNYYFMKLKFYIFLLNVLWIKHHKIFNRTEFFFILWGYKNFMHRVLGREPAKIHKSEQSLPRKDGKTHSCKECVIKLPSRIKCINEDSVYFACFLVGKSVRT